MSIIQGTGGGLGGAGAPGGALAGGAVYSHSIDQSLRFNDDDSAYLSRTPSSAGNRKTFTFSAWVKVNPAATNYPPIFSADNTAPDFVIRLSNTGSLQVVVENGGGGNSLVYTNRLFRDPSSWYHFVVIIDTTNATANDRIKVYVNGVEETSFSSRTNPSLNFDTKVNSTVLHRLGLQRYGSYWDGYMAEVNFIDGTALDPTSFGEEVNGIWVPKEVSGLTYGTNGFYLSFADSSAIGDDLSGNTNDWTANNLAASDVVLDSPTNNFCTWNPLDKYAYNAPSEGNLRALTAGNNGTQNSTFAVSSGKWYWEARNITAGSGSVVRFIGIAKEDTRISIIPYTNSDCYLYYAGTGNIYNGSNLGSYGDTWGAIGDIIGVAFDADNGAIWFSKNGTWQNSATASEIAAGTTTNAAFTGLSGTFVMMVSKTGGTSSNDPHHANFGQDSTFAGDTTAGGNADDNGIGDFKYAPPSGFLALATSSLPEPAIGPNSDTQSDDYFETILYTGNGAVQHIGSGGAQHPIDVTTVDNSLRFNDNDSAYLSRTPGSAGNQKTWTWSGWVKRGDIGTTDAYILFDASTADTNASIIEFGKSTEGDAALNVVDYQSGERIRLRTNMKFLDISSFYHILVAVDTTQATDTDRVKIYVNGEQITSLAQTTYPSLNHDTLVNATNEHRLSKWHSSARYFDGYMAEVHFIDGTALDPTSFGQVGSNGYWIPKAVSGLTYGTNGFYLDFSDNSTASALGTDSSGNTNNFSVTNIATTDQMGDSPTQNFATLDTSNSVSKAVLSEGNLKAATAGFSSSAYGYGAVSTFAIPKTTKIYIEVECTDTTGDNWFAGFATQTSIATGVGGNTGSDGAINVYNRSIKLNGTEIDYGSSAGLGGLGVANLAAGDILGCAIDGATGKVWFSRNGTYFKSPTTDDSGTTGNPSAGSNEIGTLTGGTTDDVFFVLGGGTSADNIFVNFGQDSVNVASANADANGLGTFEYAPPTDYVALVDDNIPQEGIASPDWVWIKTRNGTASHAIFDSVRGADNVLRSNGTDEENASAISTADFGGLISFDYQGFTVDDGSSGTFDATNGSGDTYVSWNWKAGGKANTFNIDGTGYASIAASPISDGTLALTGLSANTTAGFSIGTYTGNATAGATIAHALGEIPEMIIAKRRTNARDWTVYHKDQSATPTNAYMLLNSTAAVGVGSTAWNNGTFTSDVFTIGSHELVNANTDSYVFYAFKGIDGYSKVGSYIGNGNADGTFVYTGFRPAFLLIGKTAVGGGWNWQLRDSTRGEFNGDDNELRANSGAAELTSSAETIDFLSNGFKPRSANGATNENSYTYIYLAFAEQPFKYANAR